MVALKLHIVALPDVLGAEKQERRGGIETLFQRGNMRGRRPKQERRGGIETAPPGRGSSPGYSKQERRGGIETQPVLVASICIYMEAGTPWWH